jgi:hypothetical protein
MPPLRGWTLGCTRETGPSPFADNEVLVERDVCVPMTLVFVVDVERLAATIDD